MAVKAKSRVAVAAAKVAPAPVPSAVDGAAFFLSSITAALASQHDLSHGLGLSVGKNKEGRVFIKSLCVLQVVNQRGGLVIRLHGPGDR